MARRLVSWGRTAALPRMPPPAPGRLFQVAYFNVTQPPGDCGNYCLGFWQQAGFQHWLHVTCYSFLVGKSVVATGCRGAFFRKEGGIRRTLWR